MVKDEELHLLEEGLSHLQALLGEQYEVQPHSSEVSEGVGSDRVVDVRDVAGGSYSMVLVEAVSVLTPAEVVDRLGPRVRLMRQLTGGRAEVLVVAPWLSPRTRGVLDEQGFGYLDLTGNVSFRLERPAVVLRLQGKDRQPSGVARGQTGLSGARAGQLIRLLTDVAPPYQVGQLARASGISLPWVGRVLGALEAQLLLRRDGRTITWTDWPGLLRSRAQAVQLLRTNSVVPLLSPRGIGPVLEQLAQRDLAYQVAVTGSVAASAVAPLTSGGQLMFYVRDPVAARDLPRRLKVLRVEEAPNVLMLQPPNGAAFERTRLVQGVPHVAYSQLVIDCLSGNGRMPAEGEAVLEVMKQDESRWRLEQLPGLPLSAPADADAV